MKNTGDPFFLRIIMGFSLVILLVFILLLVTLLIFSWPSIQHFGISFLYSNHWNPVKHEFGAYTIILGTLIISIIALAINVPFSLGIATLIDSLLPRKIGQVLARVIELMASIPSIIYGVWGLFILLPWVKKIQIGIAPLSQTLQEKFDLLSQQGSPWACFENFIMFFVRSLPTGNSIFAASIILAIMSIPLTASVMRDVMSSTPEITKEAAFGIGSTRWEVFRNIIFPYAAPGFLGAIILGFGRTLGETMAITFVIGNSHKISGLFEPSTSIASIIANEFNEATGTLYISSLIETGLVLLIISLIILMLSRLIVKHHQVQ